MRPTHPDSERASEDTLRLQREANEELVLAGLAALEKTAEALDAQRRAEDEARALRASEEALRSTAEFRERLIGIIGHDLRSPLNTIVMAGGLLIAQGNLVAADARLADRILTSGQRMKRMISQLVEFTRARLGGGFTLTLSATDLGEVCRSVAEELRIGTSAEIQQTTEGNLAGNWDHDRLAEVISNIAGNAIDHATPGTPVLIHSHDEGEWVVTAITNEGACIPPDLLPVIFTPFRRGHAKQDSSSSHLGLGLYIASEFVRAHGGTLEVRSSDGSTAFTMRLPRTPVPCSAAPGLPV